MLTEVEQEDLHALMDTALRARAVPMQVPARKIANQRLAKRLRNPPNAELLKRLEEEFVAIAVRWGQKRALEASANPENADFLRERIITPKRRDTEQNKPLVGDGLQRQTRVDDLAQFLSTLFVERSHAEHEVVVPLNEDLPEATMKLLDLALEKVTAGMEVAALTRTDLQFVVDVARTLGASWNRIGRSAGITSQAAQRRWDPAARQRSNEYQRSRYRSSGGDAD